MKVGINAILCLAAMTTSVVMSDVSPTVTRLGKNNGDFAFDLYRQITSEKSMKGSNVFFSPFSISAAMSMVYLGSRGHTNNQIGDVMKFGTAGGLRELKGAYNELLSTIHRRSRNYTLTTANRLFTSDKYTLKQEFLKEMRSFFGAGVRRMDFMNEPVESVTDINSWVADNTNQKIKDLLPEKAIDMNTVMFLVNAVYFKGLWDEPFDDEDTHERDFHVTHDTHVDMPMMYIKKNFQYAKLTDMKAKIIEIPYQGKDVSMFVILPYKDPSINGEEALEKIMSTFNMEKLEEMKKQMSLKEVGLTLPKFKLTQEMSLKKILVQMGIEDAFGRQANFSGISEESVKLVISEVAHKAFVDVNEKGTEAAAATEVEMGLMSALHEDFTADHPFLFLIYEKTTNSVLFMGRLVKPPAEGGEARALGLFGEEASNTAPVFNAMFICIAAALFTLFPF